MPNTGKISEEMGKIFVLWNIVSDRKIYIKNLSVFCHNISPNLVTKWFINLFIGVVDIIKLHLTCVKLVKW